MADLKRTLTTFAIAAAVFIIGWLCITSACAPVVYAHPVNADVTTSTLTTPTYMIEWVRVVDAIQGTQEALRKSILAQAKIVANPESSDADREAAVRRLTRAQCNIEGLDGLMFDLNQITLLEIDPAATDYGVWVDNPLKETP